MPSTDSPSSRSPYAALRIRDYRLFLAGSLLVSAGTQMQAVAVGWDVYQRTRSSLALGFVGLIQFLPVLVFSLPAGHAADRFDRRRIMMAMQTVFQATSLGLAAVAWTQASVSLLYLLLLASAIARAFHWPARSALLPKLVPREVLANAIAWSSGGFQVASVAGPTLAGFILHWTKSPALVYAINAATSLAFLLCLALIRARWTQPAAQPISWSSLGSGLRFVWNTQVLLAAITLDLFAVLFGGATAMLPVYAEDILHVGAQGFGWLRAAPAVGAVAMAVTLAHLPPLRRPGRTLLACVAGYGLATVLFGYSTWFPLSFLALALCGALDNVSVIIRHTLVQLRTPDDMRGRVAAVNTVFISSSNELGEFESGTVAHLLGPVFSVVSGGVGTVLVVLGVAWRWPQLRDLTALEAAPAPSKIPDAGGTSPPAAPGPDPQPASH